MIQTNPLILKMLKVRKSMASLPEWISHEPALRELQKIYAQLSVKVVQVNLDHDLIVNIVTVGYEFIEELKRIKFANHLDEEKYNALMNNMAHDLELVRKMNENQNIDTKLISELINSLINSNRTSISYYDIDKLIYRNEDYQITLSKRSFEAFEKELHRVFNKIEKGGDDTSVFKEKFSRLEAQRLLDECEVKL